MRYSVKAHTLLYEGAHAEFCRESAPPTVCEAARRVLLVEPLGRSRGGCLLLLAGFLS